MVNNKGIEKTVKTLLPRLSEILASANINFLIGSGCSYPFLSLLGDIEKDINDAIQKGDIEKQSEGYKNYDKI